MQFGSGRGNPSSPRSRPQPLERDPCFKAEKHSGRRARESSWHRATSRLGTAKEGGGIGEGGGGRYMAQRQGVDHSAFPAALQPFVCMSVSSCCPTNRTGTPKVSLSMPPRPWNPGDALLSWPRGRLAKHAAVPKQQSDEGRLEHTGFWVRRAHSKTTATSIFRVCCALSYDSHACHGPREERRLKIYSGVLSDLRYYCAGGGGWRKTAANVLGGVVHVRAPSSGTPAALSRLMLVRYRQQPSCRETAKPKLLFCNNVYAMCIPLWPLLFATARAPTPARIQPRRIRPRAVGRNGNGTSTCRPRGPGLSLVRPLRTRTRARATIGNLGCTWDAPRARRVQNGQNAHTKRNRPTGRPDCAYGQPSTGNPQSKSEKKHMLVGCAQKKAETPLPTGARAHPPSERARGGRAARQERDRLL